MTYEKNEPSPELHIDGVYRTRDNGKAFIDERLRDYEGREYWYGLIDGAGPCTWTLEGKDRRGNERWDLVESY